MATFSERLDTFFHVSVRGSTIGTEIRAGCIAWMTMSYIMVVNPVILSNASTKHNPLPPESVMTATALSAAFGSLAVGLIGDAPLGLMPGMGLNAYFVFGLCLSFHVSWQEALSCSFASGAILTILSMLGVCDFIVSVVLSEHLKKAITVAIGVFQALIGFQVMGLVVASPSTLVTLGDMSWSDEQLYLAITGFLLISAVLVVGKIPGAMLIGIWLMAIASWVVKLADPPAAVVSLPRFDSAFCVSFDAWRDGGSRLVSMLVGTAVLLFVALFDLAGVQYGLMGMAGLLKHDIVPRSASIFASAGVATMVGSLFGTSPVIIANESSAGIVEGAKTGLMATVVAALFTLSAFIGPLLSAVPQVATAVPLVLIGAFMMAPVRGIDWDNLRIAIPSFITVTVVPFTYSIHIGILAGILVDLFLALFAPRDAAQVGSPLTTPLKATPRPTPLGHRLMSPHTSRVGTKMSKVEDARHLLGILMAEVAQHLDDDERPEPIPTSLEITRSEAAREEILRRALEAYLEGVHV